MSRTDKRFLVYQLLTPPCEQSENVSSPGVGFGQVVGAGIDLVDGKEPGASSTCTNEGDWFSKSGPHRCEETVCLFYFSSRGSSRVRGTRRHGEAKQSQSAADTALTLVLYPLTEGRCGGLCVRGQLSSYLGAP